MTAKGCGCCHTCKGPLRRVLDNAEWCDTCQTYRRYRSHGWGRLGSPGDCPPRLSRRPENINRKQPTLY